MSALLAACDISRLSFLVFDRVLRVPAFRLEFDELLGYVVSSPLRQYPQYGPAGLVEADALGERTPAGAAAALRHVPQLQDRHADQSIITGETVVFDTQVQLVAVRLRLVAKNAAIRRRQHFILSK